MQSDVFAGEYGAKRLADLKLRVIEHNVLVVSKYYTRITTARLAELLDLNPEEVRTDGGVDKVVLCSSLRQTGFASVGTRLALLPVLLPSLGIQQSTVAAFVTHI